MGGFNFLFVVDFGLVILAHLVSYTFQIIVKNLFTLKIMLGWFSGYQWIKKKNRAKGFSIFPGNPWNFFTSFPMIFKKMNRKIYYLLRFKATKFKTGKKGWLLEQYEIHVGTFCVSNINRFYGNASLWQRIEISLAVMGVMYRMAAQPTCFGIFALKTGNLKRLFKSMQIIK